MTSLHSFSTSRESVLPLWSAAAQSKRSTPDARAPDLFVLMQGMIFTNIQLDDFQPTLSRFIERLQLELPSEKEWIMMATVNIASIFEYNRPSSTLRKMGAVGGRSEGLKDGHSSKLVITKKAATPRSPAMAHEDKMDVDEPPKNGQHPPPPSPAQAEPEQIEVEPPLPLKLALQLTFSMLTFVLKHPTLKTNFARTTLNPYLTFILTFLSTILKSPQVCRLIERSVPWEELARFLPLIPKDIMASQNLIGTSAAPAWSMLTSGCAPPLPEDWCMRGMEWPGRKVFAPGYWKSGEDRRVELEVLSQQACLDQTDGRIEDDDGDDEGGAREQQTDTWKRWVRIIRSGVTIAQAVDGFKWVPGTKEWSVEGALGEKVKMWREDDAAQRDEEERRRTRRRWTEDSMDVDENSVAHDDDHSDWSENEADTEEVRELRVCFTIDSFMIIFNSCFVPHRHAADSSRVWFKSPQNKWSLRHLVHPTLGLLHGKHLSCSSPRATRSSSSTPTFSYPCFPWSPPSFKATNGPSLCLFPSSWSLTDCPTITLPNSVRLRRTP